MSDQSPDDQPDDDTIRKIVLHEIIPWMQSEFGYLVASRGNVNRRIDENWKMLVAQDEMLRGDGRGNVGLIGKMHSLVLRLNWRSAVVLVLLGFSGGVNVSMALNHWDFVPRFSQQPAPVVLQLTPVEPTPVKETPDQDAPRGIEE